MSPSKARAYEVDRMATTNDTFWFRSFAKWIWKAKNETKYMNIDKVQSKRPKLTLINYWSGW